MLTSELCSFKTQHPIPKPGVGCFYTCLLGIKDKPVAPTAIHRLYTSGKGRLKTKKPADESTGYILNGGVEGICIYPLETIELILPVLVDEYLFCISSQDAFQGGVTGGKGAGN